ncbi:MAG: hypothetical protein QM724_09585 [Flavobacteriales bacterium]
MDGIVAHNDIRTLIRTHAAEALEEARQHHGIIGFEQRALLFGSFRLEHPGIEVGFERFSAELNHALGRSHFLLIHPAR